jgi:hypothetical protein
MNPDGTAKTANINVNRAKMVQNRLILYIYLETPTESEPLSVTIAIRPTHTDEMKQNTVATDNKVIHMIDE